MMPVPRVALNEVQNATSSTKDWDNFGLLTPNPPHFADEHGRASSPGPVVDMRGFDSKLREVLAAQLQEDELQTARQGQDNTAESFYRQFSHAEPSTPEDLPAQPGVAPLFGAGSRQTTPVNLGGGLSGAFERRDSGAARAMNMQSQLNKHLAQDQVVSVGTIGHPHTCAEACKYRKRKSGCLLGAACTKCHLCRWRSQRAQEAQEKRATTTVATTPLQRTVSPLAAVASSSAQQQQQQQQQQQEMMRMPSPPPEPHWAPRPQRYPDRDQPAYVSLGDSQPPPPPPAMVRRAAASVGFAAGPPNTACPTPGSIGHPVACQWPCKYNSKPRGCKQGASCDRCHLCHWTRSKEHTKQNLDRIVTYQRLQ